MKISVLIDNSACPGRPELKAEHGLSFFIEQGDTRILCDMGVSSAFFENAKEMGIDLLSAAWAFVSHGHRDHSGGLETYLRKGRGEVWLSRHVFGHRFYSLRHAEKRDISTAPQLEKEFDNRFRYLDGSQYISKDIAAVLTEAHPYAQPYGNRFLTATENGRETADSFNHEYALCFLLDDGLTIVSSCSHHGAMNIIEACRRFTGIGKVKAFVGGLHFVDSDETEREVRQFLLDKQQVAPETVFYTGHCTSDKAKRLLSQCPEIRFFHTGTVINL